MLNQDIMRYTQDNAIVDQESVSNRNDARDNLDQNYFDATILPGQEVGRRGNKIYIH